MHPAPTGLAWVLSLKSMFALPMLALHILTVSTISTDYEAIESEANQEAREYIGYGALAHYEKQAHPLAQLRHHHIPAVRRWAGEQLHYIQTQTEREKTREDEREIGIF